MGTILAFMLTAMVLRLQGQIVAQNACVDPTPPNGAATFPGGLGVGDYAFISCDMGYTLSSPVVIRCTENNAWSDTPTCDIVDCGDPTPVSGFASGSVFTYGASMTVSCNDGNSAGDNTTITCLEDGSWSENPTCDPAVCGDPTPVNGASDSPIGLTYGEVAIISCNSGYNLTGSPYISCDAGAVWSDYPTCDIIDCGILTVSNGQFTATTGTTFGDTAGVDCNPGYTRMGDAIITCRDTGWNSHPNCTILDCGDPTPTFGSVSDSVFTFNSSVNVSCNAGYDISGAVTITCLQDGTWSENTSCEPKDCGDPTPTFGSVSDSVYTFNSSVNVSCNAGYDVSGAVIITCLQDGTWSENITCKPKDCGDPTPTFGSVIDSVYTFNSSVNVSCNAGHDISGAVTITCLQDGTWSENTTCEPKECVDPTPTFGSVSSSSYKYGSSVNVSCNAGYVVSGATSIICLEDGTWSANISCNRIDCSSLKAPVHGSVDVSGGTSLDDKAHYSCDAGFKLYGDTERTCLSSGEWSGVSGTCINERQPVTACKAVTDDRNTTWSEALPNQVRVETCPPGFTGSAMRKCTALATWEIPVYNCEREAVRNIKLKASALSPSSTKAEVQDVLRTLVQITTDTNVADVEAVVRLTHAELDVMSTSFQDIAASLTEDKLDVAVENVGFFEAASQMIDSPNKSTWKTLGDSRSTGAEKVIKAVDTVAEILLEQFKSSPNASKVIVKKNILVEVQKVGEDDASFPGMSVHDEDWRESTTGAFLSNTAIKGTDVVTTGIIFRDMSEITTAQQSSANAIHREINGPVVSIRLSQPPCRLVPPLRLTLQHSLTGFSKPSCSFLVNSGTWSTYGCSVVASNTTMTECECDHLTNFAVLMSPFVEPDTESNGLRIASIAGIGVSIVCILITMVVHFDLWRYLRSDRTTMLMHLCVALLLAYTLFLAGTDRTESRDFCAAVAVLLHYIFLVVFCLMLAEGIAIATLVLLVFATKSHLKLLLTCAWVLPAVIVGISMGVTHMEGFGNSKFCWLSMDSGLIWAFVGPALAIILFNMICLGVIVKVMFSTKAMGQKKTIEKVNAGVRSLGVLVPLMGTTWIIGIFYINEDLFWMQYVFAICNGLQGLFIFLFHCLLNQQVKNALAAKKRRQESTGLKSSTAQKYQGNFPGIRMTADTFTSNLCETLPDTSLTLPGQRSTNMY